MFPCLYSIFSDVVHAHIQNIGENDNYFCPKGNISEHYWTGDGQIYYKTLSLVHWEFNHYCVRMGDSNPCTMGLLAGFQTLRLNNLAVCYCDAQPVRSCIKCDAWLIKVKSHLALECIPLSIN
jgi:hypothetical protein